MALPGPRKTWEFLCNYILHHFTWSLCCGKWYTWQLARVFLRLLIWTIHWMEHYGMQCSHSSMHNPSMPLDMISIEGIMLNPIKPRLRSRLIDLNISSGKGYKFIYLTKLSHNISFRGPTPSRARGYLFKHFKKSLLAKSLNKMVIMWNCILFIWPKPTWLNDTTSRTRLDRLSKVNSFSCFSRSYS